MPEQNHEARIEQLVKMVGEIATDMDTRSLSEKATNSLQDARIAELETFVVSLCERVVLLENPTKPKNKDNDRGMAIWLCCMIALWLLSIGFVIGYALGKHGIF